MTIHWERDPWGQVSLGSETLGDGDLADRDPWRSFGQGSSGMGILEDRDPLGQDPKG